MMNGFIYQMRYNKCIVNYRSLRRTHSTKKGVITVSSNDGLELMGMWYMQEKMVRI